MSSEPDVPPPDASPPASEAQEPPVHPPAPAGPPSPPRSRAPILAIVVVALIVIGAVGGYVVGGYAFAQTKLDSARVAYNAVVDHQNALNDTVKALGAKLAGANSATASVADIQSAKTLLDQVINQSRAAQPQIVSDDASLAAADAGLKENQWLTVVRRSDLDKASTRIGHERAALGYARTITADYVLIGTFYQALFDTTIDLINLGTTSQATDLSGAAAADQALKADSAKTLALDSAPGVPADMISLVKDIQTAADDFASLLAAVTAGNSAAAQQALGAVRADSNKIQGYDFNKMGNEVDGYYSPMLDAYNAEIEKANKS